MTAPFDSSSVFSLPSNGSNICDKRTCFRYFTETNYSPLIPLEQTMINLLSGFVSE